MNSHLQKYGVVGKFFIYSAVVIFFAVTAAGVLAAGDKAVRDGGEGVKYCLVTAPILRDISLGTAAGEEGAVQALAKVSGREKGGFFAGKMRKLGFGTPSSFSMGGSSSLHRGTEAFHADSMDYIDIERQSHERSSFFPAAGFFTKTSSDGKKGVAFGAGLSSTSSSIWERESSDPCGKVSLMFGFSF